MSKELELNYSKASVRVSVNHSGHLTTLIIENDGRWLGCALDNSEVEKLIEMLRSPS